MFTYLRRLAAAFMRTRGPFHPFNPPSDPYAGVREPRRVKPGGGRSAAAAVDEPAPPAVVNAVTRNRTIALALLAAGGLLAAPSVSAQNTDSSEKPFVSGGRIDIQLAGGGYQIRAAPDNRIRVNLTRNPGGTKVEIATNGSQATVKVTNTPRSNFSATIEVPKMADVTLHLSGGELTIADITGNKDVDSYAGDVTIFVPNPNEYARVEASVKAGDINAPAFGASRSGLLQSVKWTGKGKYALRATLGAGNLVLKEK